MRRQTIILLLLTTLFASLVQVNGFWNWFGEESEEQIAKRGMAILANACAGSIEVTLNGTTKTISVDVSGANKDVDYDATDGSNQKYKVQPCQETKTKCMIGEPPVLHSTPVCQIDNNNKMHSCGNINDFKWAKASDAFATNYKPEEALIGITFSNGDPKQGPEDGDDSFAPGDPRTVEIVLVCKPEIATGQITQKIIEKPTGSKKYHVAFESKFACEGASSGLSGGVIFLIILISVSVLYLLVGVLVMRFGKGATGAEMVPNHDFWVSLPGLFTDGCRFAWAKVRGKNPYEPI